MAAMSWTLQLGSKNQQRDIRHKYQRNMDVTCNVRGWAVHHVKDGLSGAPPPCLLGCLAENTCEVLSYRIQQGNDRVRVVFVHLLV